MITIPTWAKNLAKLFKSEQSTPENIERSVAEMASNPQRLLASVKRSNAYYEEHGTPMPWDQEWWDNYKPDKGPK